MTAISIPFSGTISSQVIVRAIRLHQRTTRWLLPIAVLILVATLIRPRGDNIEPAGYMILGAVFIFIALLLALALPAYERFWGWFVFRQTRGVAEPFTGELTDDGYFVRSGIGAAHIPWAKFTGVRSNSDMLLLYRSRACYQMLASDFFASPAAFVDAVRLAEEQIVRRASTSPPPS